MKHLLASKKQGFGMIQALVALGMLGLVSAAFVAIFQGSVGQQRALENKQAKLQMSQEIWQMLFDETACKNTFATLTQSSLTGATPPTVAVIKDSAGANFYESYAVSNKLYAQKNLKIEALSIDSPASQGLLGDRYKYIAKLNVSVANARAGGGAYRPSEMEIVFIFKRYSAALLGPDTASQEGQLHTCYAMGDSELWIKKNSGDLYYNGGKVGINQTNPQATLDVGGDIKVGNQNQTCTSLNEGSMRYDSVNKIMQFCNGAAWRAASLKVLNPAPMASCTCGPGLNTGCSSCSVYNGAYTGYTNAVCPANYEVIGGSSLAVGSDEDSNFTINQATNTVTCRGQGFKNTSTINFNCQAICALK